MTSPFGSRTNPTLKNRSFHSGWCALACPITKALYSHAITPSASVSGPGISIAHSRAYSTWSRSNTSSLKPCTPGTLLIREWRGKAHQVTVHDDAVVYRGKRYRSLSEVAR